MNDNNSALYTSSIPAEAEVGNQLILN